MITYSSIVDTAGGPLTIVADADGVVLASGFTRDASALLRLVHPRVVPADQRGDPQPRGDLGPATKAALAYVDGDLTAIDTVPVRQHSGGGFRLTAWEILRHVPAGAPITYTEFALRAGNPTAVRAAASACAHNAAALFVPCHRVLRTDGSLGGFRWGLPVKRWLLGHEKVSSPLESTT